MVDMTATGWDAPDATGGFGAAVRVLNTWRPYGPGSRRVALVQLTLAATNFGNGAGVYPGEGVPAPSPSTVGFRNNIDYIIPLSPFSLVTGAGRILSWGCVPQTYAASGAVTGPRLRFTGLNGATPSAGATYQLEAVSSLQAQVLLSTSVMMAHALFVGG